MPCRNGAAQIGKVIAEVRKLLPNVIVVDDGSTDATADAAAKAGAQVVRPGLLVHTIGELQERVEVLRTQVENATGSAEIKTPIGTELAFCVFAQVAFLPVPGPSSRDGLNVALGGTLVGDIPTQLTGALNHRQNEKKHEIVHEVRLTPGAILAKITGRQKLGVNSTHHQAVGQVAEPLQVAAVSQDGVIEGLALKPGGVRWLPFLLSVQFHPERLADRYPEHGMIFRVFTQACALNGKK